MFEDFFKNKKVLITGHTGFKGAWLSLLLNKLGAKVYGYALEPPTKPSLFVEARIGALVESFIGDVRNLDYLQEVIQKAKPEISNNYSESSIFKVCECILWVLNRNFKTIFKYP